MKTEQEVHRYRDALRAAVNRPAAGERGKTVFVVETTDLKRQPSGCGSCSVCCTVLAIKELDKPVNEDCRHLVPLDLAGEPPRGGCCTIYADRPKACQAFECLWLMGVFGGQNPHHRPDRLGLMFDVQPEGFIAGPIPTAREAWPGASREGPGKEFLDELSKKCLVLIMRIGAPRSIIGPPTLMRDLQDKMATRLTEYSSKRSDEFK